LKHRKHCDLPNYSKDLRKLGTDLNRTILAEQLTVVSVPLNQTIVAELFHQFLIDTYPRDRNGFKLGQILAIGKSSHFGIGRTARDLSIQSSG
jgi:hypothetical protein